MLRVSVEGAFEIEADDGSGTLLGAGPTWHPRWGSYDKRATARGLEIWVCGRTSLQKGGCSTLAK